MDISLTLKSSVPLLLFFFDMLPALFYKSPRVLLFVKIQPLRPGGTKKNMKFNPLCLNGCNIAFFFRNDKPKEGNASWELSISINFGVLEY